MHLRFAHVADFASMDASGKLTVVGIFDIVWDRAGARPIPFPPFYLVADLEASLAEGADQEIEVQLVDADEQPVGPLIRGTMQLRAAGPGYPATGRFLAGFGPGAISLPEVGDYHFRFRAKVLRRMLTDDRPTEYTYVDAAAVLTALGFEVAPHRGGSHRKWRLKPTEGNAVVIGLVDSGNGTLKPYLVRDMVAQLRANGLIPPDMEDK